MRCFLVFSSAKRMNIDYSFRSSFQWWKSAFDLWHRNRWFSRGFSYRRRSWPCGWYYFNLSCRSSRWYTVISRNIKFNPFEQMNISCSAVLDSLSLLCFSMLTLVVVQKINERESRPKKNMISCLMILSIQNQRNTTLVSFRKNKSNFTNSFRDSHFLLRWRKNEYKSSNQALNICRF